MVFRAEPLNPAILCFGIKPLAEIIPLIYLQAGFNWIDSTHNYNSPQKNLDHNLMLEIANAAINILFSFAYLLLTDNVPL